MSTKGTKHLVLTSLLGSGGSKQLLQELKRLKCFLNPKPIETPFYNGDMGHHVMVRLPETKVTLHLIYSVKFQVRTDVWQDAAITSEQDRKGLESWVNWLAIHEIDKMKFTDEVKRELMALAGFGFTENLTGDIDLGF